MIMRRATNRGLGLSGMFRKTTTNLSRASAGLLRLARTLVIVGLGTGPVLAQSSHLPPTVPASAALQARIAEFEQRIVDLAGAKAGEPKMRRLSPQQRKARVEFVIGNIFFVAMHELGHAVISELEVPVLAREEDTADVFAIGAAMRIVANEFAHRILMGAVKGWFLSARRAKRDGESPRYYEQHGLDEQRAYHIVCLMVGHDPVRFKDLADETKLPESRRRELQQGLRDGRVVLAPGDGASSSCRRPAKDPDRGGVWRRRGPTRAVRACVSRSPLPGTLGRIRGLALPLAVSDGLRDGKLWPG